jgi:hypothetical protein
MNASQQSLISSLASAASASPLKRKDSELLPSLKSIPINASCSERTGPEFQISGICEPSGPDVWNFPLMSLRAECLANLQVLSDKCAVLLTNAGSGLKPSEWSAKYDRASQSLRTRQASLFSKEGEPGTELCVNWSRSGTICGGMYFPQPRLVQDISESGSCSSVPNPMAADGERGGRGDLLAITKGRPNKHTAWIPTVTAADGTRGPDFAKATRPGSGGDDLMTHLARVYLPTPTGRDWKDTPGMAQTAEDGRVRDDQLPRRIYAAESSQPNPERPRGGMRLTPEFLCWLMGYPPDWLKPLRDVPATQLCRKSSNPSPGQSIKC